MYIRVKKVKGYEYAYLVANKWRKNGDRKGARQKVRKYLGRVLDYKAENGKEFFEFVKAEDSRKYLEDNDYGQILKDLIRWEFNKRYIGEDVLVYYNRGKIQKNGKDICVRMNNGIFCGFTLKRLFEFDGQGAEPEVGKRLARAFVEAGIDVPQEVFVGLFEKVFEGEE